MPFIFAQEGLVRSTVALSEPKSGAGSGPPTTDRSMRALELALATIAGAAAALLALVR